jgi:nucleotide-binding universal stress UspA family protein
MYKNIMVPLDGSELAECVLGHVVDIAKSCENPTVSLIRVVPPLRLYGGDYDMGMINVQEIEDASIKAAQDYMREKSAMLAKHGIEVKTAVLFGNVIDSLLDYETKNKIDLIVIATHGRSGVGRMVLGSIADKLLKTSEAPVLMIRVGECQAIA